jgi:hypothetical protein
MSDRSIRIRRRGETAPEKGDESTPADRFEMVWPLTRQVWAFKQAGSSDEQTRAESRLPRHAVRLRRRGG